MPKNKLPEDDLVVTDIQLSNGQKWHIVNNLSEAFGLNIQCGLDNYLARHDNPTAKEFCEYLLSKQPDRIALPLEEYVNLEND